MKKIASSISVVIIFLIIASSTLNAQGKYGVVGKLFGKHEADVLFGKVIGSVQIKTDDLKRAIAKGKDYILLTIKNNRLVVTNEKRESLREDNGEGIEKDEHYYFFSKSEVEKLLQTAAAPAPIIKGKKGGVSSVAADASAITAEWRAGTLTLSTDAATLELISGCPPSCFD